MSDSVSPSPMGRGGAGSALSKSATVPRPLHPGTSLITLAPPPLIIIATKFATTSAKFLDSAVFRVRRHSTDAEKTRCMVTIRNPRC